jgi:predicted peptidase
MGISRCLFADRIAEVGLDDVERRPWIEFLLGALLLAGCAGRPRAAQPAAESPGAGAPAAASHGDPGGRQTEEEFRRAQARLITARYLLFLPRGYEVVDERRWPLILFLHGVGERGSDLELVKRHGPPKLAPLDPDFPFVVVSPQCPAGETWSNETLDALLDHVIDVFRIDERRVYLTGLSMGGYGAWSLAQEHPERFAAVVPICGGGSLGPALLDGDTSKGLALKKVAFWAIHGARDPVVQPSESERMVDALRAFGCEVKLTIVPGAGHDVWTEAYDDPELYRWLSAHARE